MRLPRKFRKNNEERMFINYRDLHRFIAKQFQLTDDQLTDIAERHISVLRQTIEPMNKGGLIVVGRFICVLSIGNYVRKSGVYKYNLLTLQRTSILSGNDLKKIFDYE